MLVTHTRRRLWKYGEKTCVRFCIVSISSNPFEPLKWGNSCIPRAQATCVKHISYLALLCWCYIISPRDETSYPPSLARATQCCCMGRHYTVSKYWLFSLLTYVCPYFWRIDRFCQLRKRRGSCRMGFQSWNLRRLERRLLQYETVCKQRRKKSKRRAWMYVSMRMAQVY